MLKPSMRVIPVGGPAARGRLANIVMFRWLIRVKSTLPHPLAAPCLAAPFPSPRRPTRRATPLFSLPWRFYTSRSLA